MCDQVQNHRASLIVNEDIGNESDGEEEHTEMNHLTSGNNYEDARVQPSKEDELTISYGGYGEANALEKNKRDRIKQLGAPHMLMQE